MWRVARELDKEASQTRDYCVAQNANAGFAHVLVRAKNALSQDDSPFIFRLLLLG
jgi:hypothetical protein